MGLLDDLQNNISTLEQFKNLTERVLNYIPEIISSEVETRDYIIIKSLSGSTKKYARPFNSKLLIRNNKDFLKKYSIFIEILNKSAMQKTKYNISDYDIVDSVTYTIQQSIGIALDLLGNPNSNRKHVGNRFEELIRLIVNEIKVKNKKIVLKIPYAEKGIYSCETDLVFSPFDIVRSTNNEIDEKEVVVSLKTTSKDRLGKIFIDKILMSRFVKHNVRVVGIFLNDIQRKESSSISYTFVPGLFMVYTEFLTHLDGVYFIDPPPNAKKDPCKKYIKRFSQFILDDIRNLLGQSS